MAVYECTDDAHGVDGGGIAVLLYQTITTRCHPQRHDIVSQSLYDERVDFVRLASWLAEWMWMKLDLRMNTSGRR